jgi:hypothetical protein
MRKHIFAASFETETGSILFATSFHLETRVVLADKEKQGFIPWDTVPRKIPAISVGADVEKAKITRMGPVFVFHVQLQ